MAIKIPSKNIYEINNPKVRDNVIDNVSVGRTIIKLNNEYEVSVYNEDIELSELYPATSDGKEKDRATIINIKSFSYQGGNFLYWYFCSHTGYYRYYKSKTFTIKIPKLQNNSFVNKIYYGKNDEGENNIKYSLSGYKNRGEVSSSVSFDIGVGSVSNESIGNIVYFNPIYGEEERFEIPKKEEFIYEGSFENELTSGTGSATSTAILYDSSTLLTAKPYSDYIENGVEYYLLEFNVICGVRIVKMGGNGDVSPIALVGTYEEYIPTDIEITIYGNTIGIDLTDGSVTYGSGKHPHSLVRNELLQDSANVKTIKNDSVGVKIGGESRSAEGTSYLEMFTTYNFNIGDIITNSDGTETAEITDDYSSEGYYEIRVTTNGYFYQNMQKDVIVKYSYYQQERLTQHLANNILSQYAKGKETATLLCSISDYYDESGEKVIDTKTNRMSFRLHDEVIPYVYGADGKDKPMSKNQDGSAKVFEVVGSDIIYDGAVWQELTLLEKTQNN